MTFYLIVNEPFSPFKLAIIKGIVFENYPAGPAFIGLIGCAKYCSIKS